MAEPVEVTAVLLDEEVREARLVVIERDTREVVTVIEVLSPTNKVPGARGRDQYLARRQEVLASGTNWVEIDLLRAGEPVMVRTAMPPCDYAVYVSWRRARPTAKLWPIRLRQRLPVVAVPLNPADPDARLDFQKVFTSTYDVGAYGVSVDYRADPVPPDLAEWADGLLRGAGLR